MFRTIKEKLNFSIKKHLPRHLAISVSGSEKWALNRGKTIEEGLRKSSEKIINLLEFQPRIQIPVITVFAYSDKIDASPNFEVILDNIEHLFNKLKEIDIIHKEKIKVSVLGKWYDLPERIVDSIKNVINETRDYDNYFFNICINYNGKEEIVDAFKILSRKVMAGNLNPDSITENDIKENIYSSYFPPPEVIILTNNQNKTNGFLLWDSNNSKIKVLEKPWPDINLNDIKRIMKLEK